MILQGTLYTAILNRIEKYTPDIIDEYQCGYQKEKSTSDHIFTIRQTIDKYEYNKDLNMMFIDFKQTCEC